MEAIFFALISFIGWGTGDVFGTIASRKIGAYATTLWAFLFGVLIFSLYIPYVLDDFANYTIILLFINIAVSLLSLIGNLAFNEGVRIGNPSLVGTISSSFVVVPILFSILFLGESISLQQTVFVTIIFVGVILSSVDLSVFRSKKAVFNKGTALAIVALFGWGLFFTALKILSEHVGWFWPQYITFLLFPLIYLYAKTRGEKIGFQYSLSTYITLFMSTLLLRAADFSFNYSNSRDFTAIAGPIAGSYPILFAGISFFLFKDPITKQQIFGIITTLIGILFLSFASV